MRNFKPERKSEKAIEEYERTNQKFTVNNDNCNQDVATVY